jgi:hypothetical protein
MSVRSASLWWGRWPEVVMTTGRFGSFEVSGVLVDHYRPVEVVSRPVVWVLVPVPLTIEHVAALLYATADGEEVVAGDVVGVRRLLVDVVAGGGWVAVSEAVEGVGIQHTRGTLSMTHWRECQRLASLVVTDTTCPGNERGHKGIEHDA